MVRRKQRIIPFEWKEFSPKQITAMYWWDKKHFPQYDGLNAIICDGAVRSGKTIGMSFGFVNWAMETFNGKQFALCGKTVGSLRRNVVAPLKQMLLSTKYTVQDHRSDNLLTISAKRIDTKTGKPVEIINSFYIFGGKDESSQDLIQGITLAGLFCDEVALMPQSFVNQATARCSVTGAKFWFNCNPDSPFHWFNKEWIHKAEEKKALHIHFNMEDNWSLSKEVIDRYKSLYTGVFYKRYIMGLWVLADGVIYPMFDSDRHAVTKRRNWTRVFMSADFGIQNPTTFGLFGYYEPNKEYHQFASYYHNGREQGQKTVKEYVDDCIKFIEENNVMPEYIAIDPSAAPLIIEMRKNSYFQRHSIKVVPAKNNVDLGIQVVSYLLSCNKFTLDPSCRSDIEEFGSYCWDSDKLEKGVEEILKINDHAMDKIRYALMTDSLLYRTLDKQIKVLSGKGAITD